MYKLHTATIINQRHFRAGTEYDILSVRETKGGFLRVKFVIAGVVLHINVKRGHWILNYSTPERIEENPVTIHIDWLVEELVETSELLEFERTSGEQREAHLSAMHSALDRGYAGIAPKFQDVFDFHRSLFPYGGYTRTVGAWASGSNHAYTPPHEIGVNLFRLMDSFPFHLPYWEYIAEFHLSFLLIHPFGDGNGRVARLLLAQHVALSNLCPVKVTDRDQYIYLLEQQDIVDLARFLEDCQMRF